MSLIVSDKYDHIILNGKLESRKALSLIHFERAFHYGDGVFETIRMQDGVVLFLEDHFKRISFALRQLQIKTPASFNQREIEKQILLLAEAENSLYKPCRIRLQVVRKNGGFYLPDSLGSNSIIELFPMDIEEYHLNHDGIDICESENIFKPKNILSGIKSCNSLVYIMAALHASKKKVNDCLIKNNEHNFTDGISSNIMVIKMHELYTPPLSDGCISGIMRKQILHIAKQEKITVKEKSIDAGFLKKADEIWLCNVIKGIVWVDSFRGNQLRKTYARIFNDKINELVKTYINHKKDTRENT